jgi:hypothetical protein
MPAEYVATIWFIDGVWHPVYEGADGRQYVIEGDGAKVYGVWFYPPCEPTPNVIVNAPAPLNRPAIFLAHRQPHSYRG